MRHFDLCVIGSGSGNSIVDEAFDDLEVALVEDGVFGGTCLNVGCIPTKMYVYPADLARVPDRAGPLGVDLRLTGTRWSDIRDRIFGKVDAVSAAGREWREQGRNLTLFTGTARFAGPRRLQVGTETITAARVVLAAGSRPVLPDVPGLAEVAFHTSDTVMRLPRPPETLAILGGGYVAAEFAHIFSSLGSRVVLVNRSERLLRREDGEVAARFTDLLGRRVELHLDTAVQSVRGAQDGGIVLALDGPGGPAELRADTLLVATGRVPNCDRLGLEAAGVEIDDDGYVVVDDHQRTTADGVFALGDLCSRDQLKHVANADARVVRHNLLHPDAMRPHPLRHVPHAVFADPQIASVGLTEERARERGVDYRVGRQDYGDTAYGWAMGDTDHFVKVLLDPGSGLILGAHLIGPQASSLIQPLVQAMSFDTPAEDVARGQYWIHPAMAEVVENALLDALDSDGE